jgi:GTP-binding protein
VDAMLKQTHTFRDNQKEMDETLIMDSNDLEKERGITIYAKNTSLFYKNTKINIVDTPGHSDFGSEVERVLRSIDTVLLVVDAQEGPMPQTRFVLKKSLEIGLKPIVVINKIDKPASRPKEVEEMVLELFMELGANDDQLDFTTVFAIGREGIAKRKLEDTSTDLNPLLDVILEEVPPASDKKDGSAKLQVFNLAYDNFLGRMGICRIYQGNLKWNDTVFVTQVNGKKFKGKLTKLFTFEGVHKKDVEEATAGDIIMLSGIPDIYIGDTISTDENESSLPAIKIDEPTISLDFLVNDSPFAGKEGKFVTGRQIRERLEKEMEVNVGLKVDFDKGDNMTVYGRGELHIAILLENMRREGYEVQVSQPKVIIKTIEDIQYEPFEEVVIDLPDEFASAVISKLSERKALLLNIKQEQGHQRLIFEAPTRGLLGYRGQFVVDTKGLGIFSSRFTEFKPFVGEIKRTHLGAMVSMVKGKALAFSLDNLQQRGLLYIEPGDEVYEGMVIGNVSKGDDLTVNPTKGKQLTNMRASGSDDAIFLAPAFRLSIERAMEIMNDDEFIEITPKSVRLRKKSAKGFKP